MPVHPQAQPFLDQLNAAGAVDVWSLSPETMRAGFGSLLAQREVEPVEKTLNRTIPGPAGEIPVRIYTPAGDDSQPVLVYFHGGMATLIPPLRWSYFVVSHFRISCCSFSSRISLLPSSAITKLSVNTKQSFG